MHINDNSQPFFFNNSSWPFVKNLLGILNLKADSKLIITEIKILDFKKTLGLNCDFIFYCSVALAKAFQLSEQGLH